MSARVVVVGAGVFGLTGALELARRGCSVTVVDPGPIPHPEAASTDVSKIVRLEYGKDILYTSMMERALAGWREWNRMFPEPLFHEVGFLPLSREALEPGGYEYDSFELLTARGHPLEMLTTEELKKRHPSIAAEAFESAYMDTQGGWVESGAVIAELARLARESGIELVEGEGVQRITERGGEIDGVETHSGGHLAAEIVVVAAGSWTPSLLPELARDMWASAQSVLHFLAPPGDAWRAPALPVWTADIARTGWYGFPALPDGTLKVGRHDKGRPLQPGQPRVVPPEEEDRFRAMLAETLPGVAGAPLLAQRVCVYCDTADGDFWIDRDPERQGLVVAAGGSGHAFKFAPILGELVADAALGRGVPARFRWRERTGPYADASRCYD